MLEVITNITTTISILGIGWMILTAPGWITGKVVARKRRALPVPVLLKPRPLRWVLWALLGLMALIAFYITVRPTGAIPAAAHNIAAAALLIVIGFGMLTAFYISWTASAMRQARKADAAAKNLPYIDSTSSPVEVQQSPQDQEQGWDDGEYQPARPADQ